MDQKRRPKTIIHKDQEDPFLVHLQLQVPPGVSVTVTPLVPNGTLVKRDDRVLNYTIEGQVTKICSPSIATVQGLTVCQATGPHRLPLASFKECDHQPKLDLAIWVCLLCGHQMPFYWQRQPVPLQFGSLELDLNCGAILFKGSQLGTLDTTQILAPFTCRIVRLQSPTKAIVRKIVCGHQLVSNLGICNFCGQNPLAIGKKYLAFCQKGFLKPRIAEQLQKEYMNRLHQEKRLLLVLDLDHTILHSMQIGIETDISGIKDYLVQPMVYKNMRLLIKFRPKLGQFLKSSLPFYQIFIYTSATRRYAQLIFNDLHVRYKDYIGEYSHKFIFERIMTRSDHQFPTKTLANIYPDKLQRMTLILDDLPNAWQKSDCVVPTRPFIFLQLDKDKQLKPPIKQDDFLQKAAGLLKRIHYQYYKKEGMDTRIIKSTILSTVLKDKSVAFQNQEMLDNFRKVVALLGGKITDSQEKADFLILQDKDKDKKADKVESKSKQKSYKNKSRNWLLRLYYSFDPQAE